MHVLHALKENLLAGVLDARGEVLALPGGGQCDPLSVGSLHAKSFQGQRLGSQTIPSFLPGP